MPDIFEQNAVAYQEARSLWEELSKANVSLDKQLEARTKMIRIDPLAALIDQLDRIAAQISIDLDDEDAVGDLVHELNDMAATASPYAGNVSDLGTRTAFGIMASAKAWAKILDEQSQPFAQVRSDILMTAIWVANRLLIDRVHEASRLQDAAVPDRIAFLPHQPAPDAPYEIHFVREGSKARYHHSPTFTKGITTACHASRVCNAMNRAIGINHTTAQSIIAALQIDEVAA